MYGLLALAVDFGTILLVLAGALALAWLLAPTDKPSQKNFLPRPDLLPEPADAIPSATEAFDALQVVRDRLAAAGRLKPEEIEQLCDPIAQKLLHFQDTSK